MARLERAALRERTPTERVSDAIARFAGSSVSLVVHALWFGGWVVVNARLIPGLPPFDPFPFGLLTTIVSLEAIFLSLFILISQNRMSRQTERRDHLDLQINLLAEQESTVTLALLRRLCEHAGVDLSGLKTETQTLVKRTNVTKLVHELQEKVPTQ